MYLSVLDLATMHCYKLLACRLSLDLNRDFFLDVQFCESDDSIIEVHTLEFIKGTHSMVREFRFSLESLRSLLDVYSKL